MQTNKKIVIRVFGGLGNQFYIYAFALILKKQFSVPVYLETRTGFIKDTYQRRYKLDAYKITLKKSNLFDSLFFVLRQRLPFLIKSLFRNTEYYRENKDLDSVQEIKKLIQLNSTIYIEGYWQNGNLYRGYENDIKNDLILSHTINQEILRISNKLKEFESVAIHVRRIRYSPLLDKAYYIDAVNKIKFQVNNPYFFVFSDDIAWCKENFSEIENCSFMENNGSDELQELWLMSRCKHFIIANSSFSWWGAFLSDNDKKIIIEPEL